MRFETIPYISCYDRIFLVFLSVLKQCSTVPDMPGRYFYTIVCFETTLFNSWYDRMFVCFKTMLYSTVPGTDVQQTK